MRYKVSGGQAKMSERKKYIQSIHRVFQPYNDKEKTYMQNLEKQIKIYANNAPIATNKITTSTSYEEPMIYVYYGDYDDGKTIYNDYNKECIEVYNRGIDYTSIHQVDTYIDKENKQPIYHS